jgi:hypothetical protein
MNAITITRCGVTWCAGIAVLALVLLATPSSSQAQVQSTATSALGSGRVTSDSSRTYPHGTWTSHIEETTTFLDQDSKPLAQIAPGAGFRLQYRRAEDQAATGDSAHCPGVSDAENAVTELSLLAEVAPGTTVYDAGAARVVNLPASGTEGSQLSGTCDFPPSGNNSSSERWVRTGEYTVPGSSTVDLRGCFQYTFATSGGEGWNIQGTVATLAIGVPGDSCLVGGDCADDMSNDFDGIADFPLDPGCTSADDASELGDAECDNGRDDDGDGWIDWPADRSCPDALGREGVPVCLNALDDDGDGVIDTADPGCLGSFDSSELGDAACDNGRDDDADLRIDFRAGGSGDPDCTSLVDDQEQAVVTLTVRFDGPGRVTGTSACEAKWAGDPAVCRFSYVRGTTARLVAEEFAPKAYKTWIGCAVSGPTCTKVMDRDESVTVRFDPVRSYAPRAYLHPDEEYGAMNPDKFFSKASLYWLNAWGQTNYPQKPCGKKREPERELIASARRLTVKRLMAGDFRYHYCRRSGGGAYKTEATIRSDQLTAPAAKGHPAKRPRERHGFYLELPKGSWKGVDPQEGSSIFYEGPAMHYELKSRKSVVYWFFFGYNNRLGDKHQGDWEHLAVRLDDDNLASKAAYYNHLCDGDELQWKSLDVVEGTHPVAYVARGGHGIWPTPGTSRGRRPTLLGTCPDWYKVKGLYDVRAMGPRWDTWTRDLVDVTENGWYGAGVGWGKDGGVGWGPLAPGRWKGNVVPSGW